MAKKPRLSATDLSAALGRVSSGDTAGEAPAASDNDRKPGSTVEALERKASAQRATPTVKIDTAVCRMWRFADRIDEGLDEDSLRELADSISRHGQRVPVIARKSEDPKFEFEVIAGRRRYEACKLAGKPVLAMVMNMDDQEAYSTMLVENDDRKDITPWSRAMSLRASLDAGIYRTQAELIHSHNETSAHKKYKKAFVSKMLTATKLRDYPYLWKHMKRESTIPVVPACDLVKALSDEKTGKPAAITVQKRLAHLSNTEALERMDAGELVVDLLAALKRSGEPAPEPVQVSMGNSKATGSINKGRLKLQIDAPAEGFTPEEAEKLVSDILKQLKG